jgi:hypothetical protein
MPVIPATQEVEVEEMLSETSPEQVSVNPYQNQTKLVTWLKC